MSEGRVLAVGLEERAEHLVACAGCTLEAHAYPTLLALTGARLRLPCAAEEEEAEGSGRAFVLFPPLFSRPAGLVSALRTEHQRQQQQHQQQQQQHKERQARAQTLARPYASEAYELA